MNREIKFRAWNIETKKMSLWDYIKKVKNLNKLLTLNHVVMMQYTGLKDKNGVEIYEGDLVKFFGIDNPCVIEFKDGGFGYNCRQRYSEFTSISGHNYLYELLETIEVIGNIYENPELLEDRS